MTLCSHASSLLQLSQGIVATLIKWGGWYSHRHTYF